MRQPQFVDVVQRGSSRTLLRQAVWCASFLCRLRGLMFRSGLRDGEAIILVEPADSRTTTTIHMFFVPFAIGVLWLNSQGRVVDKVLARPWRPFYGPRAPARYVIEAQPALLDHVSLDDELTFEDVGTAAPR